MLHKVQDLLVWVIVYKRNQFKQAEKYRTQICIVPWPVIQLWLYIASNLILSQLTAQPN